MFLVVDFDCFFISDIREIMFTAWAELQEQAEVAWLLALLPK